jgi:hypothetical protein
MQPTDWKQKAIQRSRENKRLNKRIKELSYSRDDWKEKAVGHKARADKMEGDLKKTKSWLSAIAP